MVVDMNYWTKVFRKLMIFIFTCIGIYLGFKLSVFYMPFLIAFILSLLLEPVIKWIMKKWKIPRKASAILILLLVFAIIIGFLVWGIFTLISEGSNLLGGLNGYFEKAVGQVQGIWDTLDLSKIQIPEEVSKALQNSATDFLGTLSVWAKNFLTGVLDTISSLPTVGIYTAVALLSLYFICTDRIYMMDQLEHHLPEIWVKKIGKHMRQITKTLGGYLKAEATLIVISFVISLIGLYILYFTGFDLKYPLIAALGIGFVDALPIFGSGTVMIPWAVISAFNGNLKLAIGIMIIWAVMAVVRQFLEPRIIGKQIGVHPIFTLIAMYTGFKIIGVLGMFIGPILLVILENIFGTMIDKGVMKAIFDRDIS